MKTSLLSTFAALGMFALALTAGGCTKPAGDGSDASSPSTGSPSPVASAAGDGKKLRLAFVTNNSSDFWTIAQRGTEKAASELPDVEVQFVMPSGDAADQKRVVDELLAKGVDGVAISPVDPANQTDLLNSVADKAVLVTQDSDAPASKRACYVGTDNVAAGRQAGELIKASLPNGGKIVMFVGKKDAQNAKERIQGIEEALKGSKVEVLDIRTDDADHAKAKTNVADMLVKTPDIAGLVGLWSYNGPAILSAVQDANKVGKVKIITFDEEEQTLAGVKSGAIEGTIVQQPFEFGHQSIVLMEKVAKGDKSAIPAEKKIVVPTLVIKKADVDDFSTKLKALRAGGKDVPAAK